VSRIARRNTRLEGHAVLHGDATAQRLDALNIAVGNCFAVIEEPMEAVEGDFRFTSS